MPTRTEGQSQSASLKGKRKTNTRVCFSSSSCDLQIIWMMKLPVEHVTSVSETDSTHQCKIYDF